jgi:MFS family permease
MFTVLIKTWALFFGFAIISLAHGLQGTLIGVRAVFEGFSFISTGFVIAGYYVGYLTGSMIIPVFLKRVGHIRVFAALASLASIAILLHSVFLQPYMWFLIRILTGVSLAGIYVIMESWLNDKSTNETRGQILSIYMIITFSFLGIGQLLLNLSDPIKVDLFILVSILLSFALLPILLSVTEAPNVINTKNLSLKELFIISPLGFVGAIFTGLAHSVLLGYGAVYAAAKGFDLLEISIFMIIVSSFGALFQWPIGYVSDKIDRRIVLIGVTFIASGLSLFIVISSYISIIIFFILLAIFAGMCLPLYSLTIAHTNDFLEQNQIIGASSTIAILVGLGAVFGPIIASLFMSILGSDGFFVYLFIVHGLLGLFGLYRMAKRTKPTDLESQYIPLPRNISAAGMELTPIAEPLDD